MRPLYLFPGLALAQASPFTFDWSTVAPSSSLEFTPCYTDFECARLLVPLDYLSDDANSSSSSPDAAKAILAITRLPAKVPPSDPTFGGTIFTNPGGPGGSGVGFILRFGRYLQRYVDVAPDDPEGLDERHYEVLSWDPRGVGFTVPHASCFDDDFDREALLLERRGMGALGEDDYVLTRQMALYKGMGEACARKDGMKYMGTASVARDMVEMVDRIEEARATQRGGSSRAGDGQRVLGGEEPVRDAARLQYIGFSYGTILGNTFASMFPGRVGRVILDGVADAADYLASDGWLTNLRDTERLVTYFYARCHKAGPRCPLHRSSDSSPGDIQARVESLIRSLDSSPLPALDGAQARVITGADVRLAFNVGLYSPIMMYPYEARVLADALEGNYSLLLRQLAVPRRREACLLPNATAFDPGLIGKEAESAIQCGDAESVLDKDAAYWKGYVSRLKAQSDMFGSWWSQIRFSCSGWRVLPPYRFTGPFTSPSPSSSLPDRPAAPLLFLTTKWDPVTPAHNAFAMSEGHPGSRVVVQDSAGHCAVASAPSECTKKIVRRYFATGGVPDETGVRCEAECEPWDEGCDGFRALGEGALEEEVRQRPKRPLMPFSFGF